MDVDLILSILHFLLIFALVAIISMELMLLKPGLAGKMLARLGGIDMSYGAVATLLVIVGFGRVFFGAKDSGFYLGNPVFWLKIGAFVIVGLLSIKPTIDILRWRKLARADAAFVAADAEIKAARRFLHIETTVFVLIPIFAALMARGYGL